MTRLITLILIIFSAISLFYMYKIHDTGFLNIGIGDFTLETNLVVVGGLFIVAVFSLLLIFKFVALVRKIFLYFGIQRKERLLDKARTALSHGLIELAEGRFAEAEKLLLKQVKYSDNALLAYLSAARAAQQQGEHGRRDDYLRKAHEATPTAEIAIGLTKAELQLDHQQYEQALANLTHLYDLSPSHAYVIKLLLKTYRRLADWKNIQSLLVAAKHQKLLSEDKIRELEIESWRGLLHEQSLNNDPASVIKIWDNIPAKLKSNTGLVEEYAQLLLNCDSINQAEQVLRNHLESNWSDSTIIFYSELDVAINNHELQQVESWLKEHQHNAHLLLALGKLCLNKKLWGKARIHLETSLSIQAMPETYLKLAQLLEQHMDEPKQAQIYYRQGLKCLAGELVHDIKTGPTQDREEKPDLKIVQTEKI